MLKFERISPVGRDETAAYNVILDKEYTVKSLLDEIILDKREWGKFCIMGGGSSCEYKWGKLLSELNKTDLPKKVIRVNASGGWSKMDYMVFVK